MSVTLKLGTCLVLSGFSTNMGQTNIKNVPIAVLQPKTSIQKYGASE